MNKDIAGAIVVRLKADTAICSSTYCGATPNQRVYRGSLPQDPVFPCIVVYHIDARRPTFSHCGSRIGQSRIQCTVFAKKDADADIVSELIANSLHGMDNSSPGLGVWVVRSDDAGALMDSDPVAGVFLYHRDFIIQHNY